MTLDVDKRAAGIREERFVDLLFFQGNAKHQ
jgi:hypothetical protein